MRLMSFLFLVMLALLGLTFGCVLAAIWMPGEWWQWLMTALALGIAAAAVSNVIDSIRKGTEAVNNVTNIYRSED